MAIKNQKVKHIYDTLKSGGADVGTEDEFNNWFFKPGKEGYENRKYIHGALKDGGDAADMGNTYEEFRDWLGLQAAKPQPKLMPAEQVERRVRTRTPHPLDRSKARRQLQQQQQAIENQQKRWQKQSDQQKKYVEQRTSNIPGGMERFEERAKEQLATGEASPMPIAPNDEVVRGDLVFNDDGQMTQSYLSPDAEYSSRAGAEAVEYRKSHPLEDELQQAYLERERLQEEMGRAGNDAYNTYVGSGAAFMPLTAQATAMRNSPEFSMLSTAYHQNEQRIKTLERERDADGFWRTLGKELFSLDTWDFGAQEFMDASALLTYGAGDNITAEQQEARESMLLNTFRRQGAEQEYGENDTFMQRAATITAQAIPFVVQFIATGGMEGVTAAGSKLGTKMATKFATGKVGEWILKNTGVLAGDVAAGFAMANTVGALSTGADIMERHQGQLVQGPDGSFHFEGGKSWGRSIYEGEVANTLEYYTEMLGAHLDGLGGAIGAWISKSKAGQKVGIAELSRLFSRVKGSEIYSATNHLLRKGGFNEYPSEVIEEEANLLLNAMLVGDNKFSDLVDPKTQMDIWGGMMLSVGFMQGPGAVGGIMQAAQYYRYKQNTDLAGIHAGALLGSDKWDALKDGLDNATNEEAVEIMHTVLADENLNDRQRGAVVDYVANMLKMRGYNLRTMADAKDKVDEEPDTTIDLSNDYQEGYETVTPEERRAAKDRLDVARARLEQKGYSEQWMQWVDGTPIDDVMSDLTERGLAGDTEAVTEYLNAKAAYDGMLQRVNDDIDVEVAIANEAIDQRIAPENAGGDGMIHPAVLKGGREVFILSGNVATLADNSIDTENSDSMIIVRDAEGNEDTISPDMIQSLGEVQDPAQLRDATEQAIVDEQGQAAAAQIEGALPFNVGDQYTISYQGEPHTYQVVDADENNVAVLVDGAQEPVVLTKQQLQQMADEDRAARIAETANAVDNGEGIMENEEPAAVEPEQPVEAPAVEETPAAPVAPEDNPTPSMPMDDQGEPAWDQVEPEIGHQFLYQESGWPQTMADNFVQKRIDDAEKALKKAQEAGQKLIDNPKPTFSAQQQAVAENTAAQQAAQSALDYWNAVKNIASDVQNGEGVMDNETAPVVETPAEQEPTEQAAPVTEAEAPAEPVEPEASEPVEETPAVEVPATVAENEMQPVEEEQPAEAAPAEPAAEGDVNNATDETAPEQSDETGMPNTLPGNHIELNYESGKDAESRAYIEEVMEREGWDEEAKSEFRKILDDAADLVSRMAQGFTRLREWNNKKLTDEQGNYNPLWRVWDKAVGWIPNRSSFKKNGEYPYNIDLGALCTKREAFDAVVRYIKEQGWGQNLGPTQIEALKSLLREHGFLTACDICFNETKRARALDYGNAVAYYWNAVRQAVGIDDDLPVGTPRELTDEQMKILTALSKAKNGKAFSKYIPKAVRRTYETYTNTKGERKRREADKGLTPTMTAKIAKLFLQDPSLMGRFEGTTLLSTDSVDALVRQHPQTDIAEFIAGAWGSATPKPNEGFNIYDPLSWKQAYDKKRQRPAMDWFFNLGGFRAQSFSDYHPIFFYDYVQMFTDLAIRRLPIHIYTKVPALIKLFGGTGAKFNMSLVPEVVQGVDAEHLGLKPDGNGGWELAWHEDSFPVDEAFALRQDPRFKGNVGTIAVGISDAHIRMLLDDPRIDMVIPYHKSGMPKSVQIKTGLNNATDYTDDQKTKGKKKGLKDFSFNEALRRLGDPRKAADEYLAWCKQNKCTPKFPQFADHPNYYKVLEDFRCIDNEGNYSPQQPVQVSFFDDVEQRLSESLEDRTMQEGLDTAIRGNDAITEGIKKIMSKPRLDGKIRDMMLARLKQVLGKDNVASLKQEDFFEELQKVYTDQMGAERAQQQVEVLRTSGGIVYGFAVGDRIVLNENYFNAETPMHEFTHVWVKVARLANPQMWAEGKELLKQTKEWQEVMSDEFYRDIQGDEEAVASEVLARIVGQDAARQINEMFAPEDKPQERPGIYNKIKQWVNKFLDGVRSLFDSKAKGLTYDELVRMPMKALFDDAEAARFMEALQQVNEEEVDLSSHGSAPTFYSNAAKAVEKVKQNKATAEQWKAMLTKAGGIKAGEDKWMGLSTWLDEHKGETLTKDEVLQFVADNGIEMEEVNYGDKTSEIKKGLDDFANEFDSIVAQKKEEGSENDVYDEAFADMVEKYGEDFDMAFMVSKTNFPESSAILVPVREYGGELSDAAKYFLGVDNQEDNLINKTRLDYTTPGLENKREIAFVVPGVEPYQEHDEIHFGPENQGRAIMWVRFGETTDTDGNRVLVIDEVQSNRHQEGRDKGYQESPKPLIKKNEEAREALYAYRAKLKEKYPDGYLLKPVSEEVLKNNRHIWSGKEVVLQEEEARKLEELQDAHNKTTDALIEYNSRPAPTFGDGKPVPAAPFEKNWHEVAMKRMLRLAAEEGFDKVAWTTGAQQADRYDLRKVIGSVSYTKNSDGTYNIVCYKTTPEAGEYTYADDGLTENQLRETIGAGLTEKIVNGDGDQFGSSRRVIRLDENTSISGGEGMSGFYDKMLPLFMNKYGKRWGVKVGEVTLDTPGKEVMHSVDVTPEMRRSVMTEGQPLFQIKGVNKSEERTLMGMHNITAEKLRSALKLGGLANPSMAVINTEVGGFSNFGEISLIPSADLIASRTGGNAGTWGADAYSPRFPETHRRLGKGGDKKMRAWVKGLKMRQEMEYNTEEQFNDYYNGFNIRDNALVYPFLHEKGLSGEVDYYTHMNVDQRLEDDLREVNGDQWALLRRFDEDEEYKKKLTDIVVGDELKNISKKEGETFQEFRDRRREWAKEIRETLTEEDGYINRNLAEDLLYAQARAYRENGKFNESYTHTNAEKYIRDHGMQEEYQQYFEQKMQELGAETQIYAGSDSQGRSKFKAADLDQVSKQMKKNGRAGGEGGIFEDSPGAIRAKLLTPMKTLDQIRKQKGRIVDHEQFEKAREDYQNELREYADTYARGSMGALADILTSGNMQATAKQYNIDLDADAVADLNGFKDRIRALPTEYFETKFERPVMLDEFKKAVVPDNVPVDLRNALENAGLEVVQYPAGDTAARERVTLDAVKDDEDIRFRDDDEDADELGDPNNAVLFRELDEDEDAELIDRLEKGPHITTYSTKIKVDDGYVPPMSSKDNETGEMRAPEHEQKWNESEERPDLAKQDKKTGKWKFDLKKSNDKDVNGVLYNPYNHSGSGMLNDQFSEAQDRDDLVVVEQVVPQSEETDKYKAEKANDPTGWKAWKAGPITAKMTGKRKVFLSRWHKITRVVPWSEVADAVAKDLGDQFDVLPTNPFPPQLRNELEDRGYKFIKTDNKCVIQEGEYKGATWSERYYDVYPDRAKDKDKKEKGARAKAVKEKYTKDLFDYAKKRFGVTTDFNEAGYILPDGTMLDFSGRHELNEGDDSSFLKGRRTVDHRYVSNELSYQEDGWTPTGIKTSMTDFIERGAIRINGPSAINLAVKPTKEQEATLRHYLAGKQFVMIDFGNGEETDHYAAYGDDVDQFAPYLKASRVLGDISRYFDDGIKPEGTARFREVLEDGGTLKVYQSEGKWRVEGVPGEFDTQFGAVDNARNFLQGHVFEVAEDGNSIEVLGAGSNLDNMQSGNKRAEERARKWRERTVENGRRRVEELGQRLGVKVTIVDDMSEQEHEGMSKKKRRAKGWYDVRTGEVFINLGNHKTVSDIEATFLHEVVAHKGLRRLFGEEFNTFLHNVYYNVDASIREEINRLMAKNNWDYREATEEYLAKLAQQMNFERPEKYVKAWETVKRLFNSLLQKVGLGNGMNLKDSDLQGILFESYHNMEKEGVAGLAESTAFRDQMERKANAVRSEELEVRSDTVAAEASEPSVDQTKEDREYMDAVESGDIAKASRMVMEAAKRAMPNTKVVDENGNPLVVYHTNREGTGFYVFDTSVKRNRINMGSHFGTAVQAANIALDGESDGYKPKTYAVYLDLKNPLYVVDFFADDNAYWANLLVKLVNENNIDDPEINAVIAGAKEKWPWLDGNEESLWTNDNYDQRNDSKYQYDDLPEIYHALRNVLERLGYDGFVYENQIEGDGLSYVAFHPAQIKSAEAVTRDNDGNVIPLSERFNPEKEDIRFRDDDDTIDDYNHEVNTLGRVINVAGRDVKPRVTRFNFQEAFQDAILSVKKLQQVVCKKYGLKSLPSKEDAWTYENRLQSINMRERKHFINEIYEKMMKVHDKLIKNGATVDEINEYVICKHGLERNKVFAQRDANAEANEIARNGGVPDMQQLLDKYRQRDYSGLTAITGLDDIADIEAEAQRRVDAFEQKHGALCNELWGRINDATKWTLRRSYECGMMSAQTYIKVRDMFQWYVPLRGFNETTAEDVYDYMMGDRGAFNGTLKTAEGRTSLADDPFATIGNMGESAIVQGNRNKLKQRLWNMATQHPTDVCQVRDMWVVQDAQGNWIADFPDIPEDADADTIAQILEDHETAMTDLENRGLAKRVRNDLDIGYRIDQRNVPEHAVVVMMNGDRHVVYINGNPRAAQAINGNLSSDKGSKNAIRKLIDFIFKDTRRYYSSVITSYNINFSGANFVRDLPHAYAMTFTKYGFARAAKYIAKSFQCIPWVIKNQFGVSGNSRMDQLFHEFVNYGGVTGYAHINDVDAWKADNRRRLARLNALGRATVGTTKAIKAVIEAIGWFSETLELIPRFTTYCASRDAGMDIQQSIKEAKDITTNFNKKGTEMTPGVWGAVANTLRYTKMFFNPIVQGMYQWFDVAKGSKAAKARLAGLMLWMPAMGAMIPYLNQFLLAALGGDDDDDYFLQNEFTRRQNMLIFTGKGYVKIPIAPVFRELYGMGETVATRACGRIDDLKMATDFVDQLRTVFSLEGQSNYREWSIARAVAPEQYAPIVDIMNNENFTGKQLWYESDWTKSKPEYTKAKESTWSPLVNISRTINGWLGGDEDIKADQSGKWLNPVVWQHLITNYGGGFAQVLGDVTSSVNNMLEGESTDVSQWPIAKRFYTEPTAERANWARYALFKQYETEYNKAKDKYAALKKRGVSAMEMAKEIDNFAQRHPRAASIYAAWNGGIKGADYVQRMKKLREEGNDDEFWALVKEAVGKADGAMRKGYAKAWEEERVDRPESTSDDELYKRFDDARTDSLRAIYSREIATRNGIRDALGKAPSSNWKEETKAYWETYKELRKSSDILEDAKAAKILDDDEKKYLKEIRQGLGQGDDDDAIMEEHRQERKRMLKEHGEQ